MMQFFKGENIGVMSEFGDLCKNVNKCLLQSGWKVALVYSLKLFSMEPTKKWDYAMLDLLGARNYMYVFVCMCKYTQKNSSTLNKEYIGKILNDEWRDW